MAGRTESNPPAVEPTGDGNSGAARRGYGVGGPDPSAEVLPPIWAGPVRRIVTAVAVRQLEEARQLARQLQWEIERVRGPQHPEALRAREVTAHLAYLGGEHAVAAALYHEVAEGWGRDVGAARRTATRNARACERISASAGAAARPVPRHGAGAREAWRVSAVTVSVIAALVVGVGTVAAESRSAAAPVSLELAATPVVQVLRHAPAGALPATPRVPGPPDPAAAPSPGAMGGATVEATDEATNGATAHLPHPHPSHPAAPHAPPVPTRTPQQQSPNGVAPAAPDDICATGSRYGHLPADVVDMCRSVYGG